MIPNCIKNRSVSSCSRKIVLLRGITSKHEGNFYCLNSLHFFASKQQI